MTNDIDNPGTEKNNEQRLSLLVLQQHGFIDELRISKVVLNDVDSEEHSPWFISALFGFSGFFASLFFIGFLTLLLIETKAFESTFGLLITGMILSVIGWFLFYNVNIRHSPFWNSLAFAITLTAQGYIVFALLATEIEPPLSIIILLLIQLLMTIVIPNFVYRLISAIALLGCVVYLCRYYPISEISLALLALITIVTHLQRYSLLSYVPHKWRSTFIEIISAMAYASAFVLLSISVYFISAEYGNDFLNSREPLIYNYYLSQVLLTLSSLYAAYLILKRYQVKLLSATGLIIVGAIAMLGALSIYVSGLLATSLIIVIAIANSQRVLLALGIIALVSYVFWYYYQLDTSLLLKSASMLIIGIGLLLMRWLLVKRYFGHDYSQAASAKNTQERLL